MVKPLADRVALVAGATRGAGRGIAACLGEAGATVYCTGRSTRARSAMLGRPETIEETASLVTARGGRGIAVHVDHTDPAQVEALVRKIEAEQPRLDLLVNDVWGGDELSEWGKPFWEQSLDKGLRMIERGLLTHVITARLALPMMVRARRGLVIEIGDGSALWYRENFFYDLVKTSVLRLGFALSEELAPQGVTALSLTPGFLRSEAVLDHFGVTEATWREAIAKDPHFAMSETPRYIGRAVVALACDPHVARRAGQALDTGTLAAELGFTDDDGTQPCWSRYFERTFPEKIARLPPFLGAKV